MKSNVQEVLWTHALKAYENAHAPYSNFKVGAALIDEQGHIFSGCNIENSSYGATLCAERAALAAMVTAGGQACIEMVVVSNTPEGCPPCGLCRQVLSEFSNNNHAQLKIHVSNIKGVLKTYTLSDLLPHAFNKTYL